MPRKKKEEITAVENVVSEAAEVPVKKTRKPRAKKEVTAEATAPAEKPARKPRAPRKKAVVPNFVIQNSADDGITYASVVEKVQAAVTIKDVTSLDIYVKAEEGKAYYVVNGEAAGAVDLF
jgi:predicted transcriptional regulator